MPSDVTPSQSRSKGQRIWLALSIANVWACGVATAQHDVSAMLAAVFFAFICWAFSDTRVEVWWDSL